MTKIYADAGTSWSKVLEIYEDENDLKTSPLSKIKDLETYSCQDKYLDTNFKRRTFLFPSRFFAAIDIKFDCATGHMVKDRIKPGGNYQNEVLSLAYGAKKILNNL
ncbi:unnamed protein product, partial [marine sediment metagenome]